MQKFAILIDYENFTCSPSGLQRFIADFSSRGALVVKRAYADWVRFAGYRQQLLASQVEMIELPCATKGKNSADIRLVVDAMEFVFTKPHISTFVVASADADFLPLLSRLREYNKRTIVVASTRNTQAYMRTHCDEFVNGDVYLSGTREKTNKDPLALQVASKLKAPTSEQLKQIQALLEEVWGTHGLERPLDLAALGSQIKKLNAGLDWREYGFKSLKPMVAYLVTYGLLRIELTNGSMDRIYLSQPANQVPRSSSAKTTLHPVSTDIGTDTKDEQAELVTLIKSLSQQPIRWDVLRAMLIQINPNLLKDVQSDDAFLKLLQSLDARGSIDVSYDASQAAYYVASTRTDRFLTRSLDDSATKDKNHTFLWTQPELF